MHATGVQDFQERMSFPSDGLEIVWPCDCPPWDLGFAMPSAPAPGYCQVEAPSSAPLLEARASDGEADGKLMEAASVR
jgi:hypothetical protein